MKLQSIYVTGRSGEVLDEALFRPLRCKLSSPSDAAFRVSTSTQRLCSSCPAELNQSEHFSSGDIKKVKRKRDGERERESESAVACNQC